MIKLSFLIIYSFNSKHGTVPGVFFLFMVTWVSELFVPEKQSSISFLDMHVLGQIWKLYISFCVMESTQGFVVWIMGKKSVYRYLLQVLSSWHPRTCPPSVFPWAANKSSVPLKRTFTCAPFLLGTFFYSINFCDWSQGNIFLMRSQLMC